MAEGWHEELAALCPANTSNATLYTYKGTQEVQDVWLFIVNRSASSAAATVYFVRGGGTPGNQHVVLNGYSTPANSYPVILPLPPMRNNDQVVVQSSVANAITFKLVGERRV